MPLSFRFAVISDPHIALPHTIWDNPHRFHLVEVSIPALDAALTELEPLDLDFLLLPGDLTQHGEAENHTWLAQRLAQLPYPVFVIPGNHDIIQAQATDIVVGLPEFPHYYQKFGYDDPTLPYYSCSVTPGVRLIGLNSIAFDADGRQIPVGHLDSAQLRWLEDVLHRTDDELVMVMVHHNVLEHIPGQAKHGMGRRYMLENAADLLNILEQAGVQLIFTGHLHVQDVAQQSNWIEITTGSLVSYPHPYRILHFVEDEQGVQRLKVVTEQISAVPGWDNLQHFSREWMGDRSFPFMRRLLTEPPLSLPGDEAEFLAPELRYFWADIAAGDALFDFSTLPPRVRRYLNQFSAVTPAGQHHPIDNDTVLTLARR